MITETPTKTAFTPVVRTATSRCQCHCARPLLGYRAEIRDHRGAAVECTDKPLPTRDSARQWARAYQEDHPGAADVRIDPVPNQDYQPQCAGAIAPGDQYIADTASERRYCLRCGFMRAATIESASA